MECMSPVSISHPAKIKVTKVKVTTFPAQSLKVPCGKCAYCLVNRRAQWVFRIEQEMRTQKYPGYFLTLTYDEKHVSRADDGRLSLRFRDLQLYFKRLRKAKHYVKYVAVGEYGSKGGRPHYHLLLWTDATPQFLQENWKSSKDGSIMGRIDFGQITVRSAMYCLKYILQPKVLVNDSIEKTRAQFSRGIGLGYLSTAVYDFHTWDYENPIMHSRLDGHRVSLPKYYKDKIFTPHQRRKENEKYKEEIIKKDLARIQNDIAQGVVTFKGKTLEQRIQSLADYRLYRKKLTIERAARIIENTKHTERIL